MLKKVFFLAFLCSLFEARIYAKSRPSRSCDGSSKFNRDIAAGLAAVSMYSYSSGKKARSKFSKLGFSNVDFIDNAGKNAQLGIFATDTQALLASHNGVGVLSFRGTEFSKIEDVVSDLVVVPVSFLGLGNAHMGFAAALGMVWGEIESLLKKRGVKKLWITGHSLGGALANLAAVRYLKEAKKNSTLRAAYVFGPPKVGSAVFVQNANALFKKHNAGSFYVRNGRDMVTSLPFKELFQFRHVGTQVVIDKKGALKIGEKKVLELILNEKNADKIAKDFMDHEITSYIKHLGEANRSKNKSLIKLLSEC